MWSPCNVDNQCNDNYKKKALDKDYNNSKEKGTALKLTQNGETKLKSFLLSADISEGLMPKGMKEVLANETSTNENLLNISDSQKEDLKLSMKYIKYYNKKNGITTHNHTNLHFKNMIADTHLVNATGINSRMITDANTYNARILVAMAMISLVLPLALILVMYKYFQETFCETKK